MDLESKHIHDLQSLQVRLTIQRRQRSVPVEILNFLDALVLSQLDYAISSRIAKHNPRPTLSVTPGGTPT